MDSKFLFAQGLIFAPRKVSLLAENSTFVNNPNSCQKSPYSWKTLQSGKIPTLMESLLGK